MYELRWNPVLKWWVMVSLGRHKKTSNASSETGSWTHGNLTSPEDKAKELRNILKKLMKGENNNY